MMESSVKSISRPVIDRLPVNQLDEFACRQLDRVSDLFFNTFCALLRSFIQEPLVSFPPFPNHFFTSG